MLNDAFYAKRGTNVRLLNTRRECGKNTWLQRYCVKTKQKNKKTPALKLFTTLSGSTYPNDEAVFDCPFGNLFTLDHTRTKIPGFSRRASAITREKRPSASSEEPKKMGEEFYKYLGVRVKVKAYATLGIGCVCVYSFRTRPRRKLVILAFKSAGTNWSRNCEKQQKKTCWLTLDATLIPKHTITWNEII